MILYPDLDRREQKVPAARRCQIARGRDLAQILQHRFLTLRNIDREVERDPGTDRDREVADPGHRQIGEDGLAEIERASRDTHCGRPQGSCGATARLLSACRCCPTNARRRPALPAARVRSGIAQRGFFPQPLAAVGLE